MADYFSNDVSLPWFLVSILDELLIEAELKLPENLHPGSEMFELSWGKGFMTREWFGPFLMGPRRQILRGKC